jgi:hypothetical protein
VNSKLVDMPSLVMPLHRPSHLLTAGLCRVDHVHAAAERPKRPVNLRLYLPDSLQHTVLYLAPYTEQQLTMLLLLLLLV